MAAENQRAIRGSRMTVGGQGWARRLARIDTDRWELESGEAQHAAHPETFWIPPDQVRHALRVGQAVKLLFVIEGTEADGSIAQQVERMWAIVAGQVDGFYIGILESQPASIEPGWLDAGSEFVFKAEHVIDVGDPPRDYLVARYGDRLKLEADV